MKRHKRKGSAVLLVISILGILSIVGTSVLAATTANYKLRIQENNKIKNLYSAESGIDMAYLELINCVENALEYGREKANDAASINKDIEEQNRIYKEGFVEYLLDKGVYKDKEFNILNGKALVSSSLMDADGTVATNSITEKIATLTSSYIDENGKERIVSVSYNIAIPKDISSSNSSGIGGIVGDYAFATDGDLKLFYNTSQVNILGDIWVNGRRNLNMYEDPIKSKYDGGIDIVQSNITFSGNVITPSNITTQGVVLQFDESIYAENLVLGDKTGIDNGDRATVRANDLYLANDLVINTSGAAAKIKNIFGFNDANLVKDGQEVRGSSSIIVNSMGWINGYTQNNIDGYLLKVTDSAYLMGSAYINAKDDIYQTGESVALRGNYKAYSYPYMGEEENSQFTYLDPLLLINKNGDGQELTIVDKAEHFKYISENVDKLGTDGLYEIIKRSIISLPTETYTVGATISDNKVNGASYSIDKLSEVQRQKEEFVKKAYYMGDYSYDVDQFNDGKVAEGYSVLEQINWDEIKNMTSYEDGLYYYEKTSDGTHIIASDVAKSISIENGRAVVEGSSRYDKLPIIGDGEKVIIITKGKASCKWWPTNIDITMLAGDDIEIFGCNGNVGALKSVNDEIESGSEAGKILAPILGRVVGGSEVDINGSANSLISKGKWTLVK